MKHNGTPKAVNFPGIFVVEIGAEDFKTFRP